MVRLRLTRMGRKKRPYYRIIAVDNHKRRDGAFIDRIGYYHPLTEPPTISIDADKALKWLRDGAQPSDTVLSLLRKEGVWLRFRLERRGMPQSQIDSLMNEWFAANSGKRSQIEAANAAIAEKEKEKAEPKTETEPAVTTEPAAAVEPAVTELPTTTESVDTDATASEAEKPAD